MLKENQDRKAEEQGCADGGVGALSPNIFNFARKLVKSQPFCERVCYSIFCDLFFLVSIVGQLVKVPPSRQKVSLHITA